MTVEEQPTLTPTGRNRWGDAPMGPSGPQRDDGPPPRRVGTAWGWAALLVAALAWSMWGIGLSPAALLAGRDGAARQFSGLLEPDLSAAFLARVGAAVVETVQISIAGLLLAVLLAAPGAVLLARNVGGSGLVRSGVRVAAALLRGIPDLVWALVFVAAIGPGPAAGALAIAVHGAGLLAKPTTW